MASNSRIANLCARYGDKCALLDEDGQLSFSELYDSCIEITKNMKTRSVVLVIATNTIECVVGYVGFVSQGIIPLMVSPSIGERALLELVDEYKPEYIWHNLDLAFDGSVALSFRSYRLIETGYDNGEKPYPDLAILLTTSGSTGSRKYVRISYQNLESNARAIAEYLQISDGDRAITTLPLSYSYGLSIVNSHLLSGASLVLTDRSLFDRKFWALLNDCGASTFGGVPYTYEMLKKLHFDRMDLPSLKVITQAGGRLGEDLHREFAQVCEKKGIAFVVMYGQTEATARLMYLPPKYASKKIGYIGVPIPGGNVELIDEFGEVVAGSYVPGELVYSGSNVSLGYATSRKDLSLGDERRGRLETGDMAIRDEDGFYRIVGRKKRFLKIFGNRVNLDEVESLLAKEGFVAACAGEDDHMVIYVEPSKQEDGAIRSLLSNRLGLYKGAFVIKRIDGLPRNDAGKVLYANLEECGNA